MTSIRFLISAVRDNHIRIRLGFLTCFILLSFFHKPGKAAESDSLYRVLLSKPTDSLLFDQFAASLYKAVYNNPDRVLELARDAKAVAVRTGNHNMEARMYMQTGIAYDLKGMYDSAFLMYDEGIRVSEKHNLNMIRGDLYNNYSITLAVTGALNESINYALKALDLFEDSGDSMRIAKIYNNLGARYSDMEQNDKALDFYFKAAEINASRNDQYRLAHNFGNIGLIYYNILEDEKALNYFKKSLDLQDTVNNRMDYSIALHNLSLVYNRLGQYDTALIYEFKALNISNALNDELGRIASQNGLAAIYDNMGYTRKALDYLLLSEDMAEKLGARYYLINIYEKIAIQYAELKIYDKAFEYNQKYSSLKDSILTLEKDQALGKIEQYQEEKTEKEIEVLTLESELQKTNIKRQKLLRNSIAVVGILLLVLAAGLFHRYRYVRKTRNELEVKNEIIHKEKERSDELLLNILPEETAQELKTEGRSNARYYELVSVMFTDFKGFTAMAEKLSPQELVNEIDHCYKNFDQIISKYKVEKIKTIGDAYMCAGGLPAANTTNPLDVVRAALDIQRFMEDLKESKTAENRPFFELRIGIHTGPVVAGIVGIKKFQYDIWGDTVNIASRMESSGAVGKVNISLDTYEKVKDHFRCIPRGKISAKGKGEIEMFFVESSKVKTTVVS